YELVQGDKRAPVWRLWLLAALVPLAAGLAFGLYPSVLKGTFLAGVAAGTQPQTAKNDQVHSLRTQNLGFAYAIPKEWNGTDYTLAPNPQPFVVVSRLDADRVSAANLDGELVEVKPTGTV